MAEQTVCKAAWGLAVMLSVLANSSAVVADDTRIPKAVAPVPAEPQLSPPTPAPLAPAPAWPSLQSLLHLPGWMSLDVQFTAEPMGGTNPGFNGAGSASWIQQVMISTEISRGLNRASNSWQEFDHWGVNLQLSSFSGDPNLNLALGTAFPLQTAAHPVGLWLTEASLQRHRGDGALDIRAGLLPMNPSFVENPSLDSYIHSALNNTLNLLIPGLPINPFVAPGAELRWQPADGHEIRLAGYWLDSETALAAMLGVDPVQADVQGTLQILQWNLSNLPGSQRVAQPIATPGGPVTRQLPDPLLQLGAFTTTAQSVLEPTGANQGIYGSLTLPVTLPIGLDNRIWMALSNGFNSEANPFPLFVAGGWLNQGVIPGRPLDVLAFGFGRTSFSPQLTPGSFEAVLELNYAININAQLSLQPVIQWIVNPGGSGTSNGAYAAGLQINVSL